MAFIVVNSDFILSKRVLLKLLIDGLNIAELTLNSEDVAELEKRIYNAYQLGVDVSDYEQLLRLLEHRINEHPQA